ncbi:hypothetical protein BC831DRAFT_452173 [Entophlyctis helioformis]|nr:hypothetical protein BC831DRAFT_452173 [Entophlyctis helioformis]
MADNSSADHADHADHGAGSAVGGTRMRSSLLRRLDDEASAARVSLHSTTGAADEHDHQHGSNGSSSADVRAEASAGSDGTADGTDGGSVVISRSAGKTKAQHASRRSTGRPQSHTASLSGTRLSAASVTGSITGIGATSAAGSAAGTPGSSTVVSPRSSAASQDLPAPTPTPALLGAATATVLQPTADTTKTGSALASASSARATALPAADKAGISSPATPSPIGASASALSPTAHADPSLSTEQAAAATSSSSSVQPSSDADVSTASDPVSSLREIERKLRSHGPYVRVFKQIAVDVSGASSLSDTATVGATGAATPTAAATAGPDTANGARGASPAPLNAMARSSSLQSRELSAAAAFSSSPPPFPPLAQPLASPARQPLTSIPGIDVSYGSAKELSQIDVSTSRSVSSAAKISPYPAVIRTPPNITRVTIGTPTPLPRSSSPSQMSLARPVFARQGLRYARSSSASRSSRSGGFSRHSIPTSPNQLYDLQQQIAAEELMSTPLLPFLNMTNSLQLYLKLNVLSESERIIAWIPGSYLCQNTPFVSDLAASYAASPTASRSAASRLFGGAIRSLIRSLSSNDASLNPIAPPTSPGYLLLTTAAVYIFRPLFSLFNLKLPLKDEQTSYLDPSSLLGLVTKFTHADVARVDVGPSRQHVVFRVSQQPNAASSSRPAQAAAASSDSADPAVSGTPNPSLGAANGSATASRVPSRSSKPAVKPRILSWVFLTRSRTSSTQIVDYFTTHMHELRDAVPPNQHQHLLQLGNPVNQDIESTLRNLQSSVFLTTGSKDVRILSYDSVWASPSRSALDTTTDPLLAISPNEHDPAAVAEVTKVDFDFLRFYSVGCFLRYLRPVAESATRSVKLEHVSVVGTCDYIYVLAERLDVWPPLIMPLEYTPHPSINGRIDTVLPGLSQEHGGKGYVADIVPQFEHILGVGRVKDILRVERWRTWRIDSALGLPGEGASADFRGLGEALQNGFLGYFGIDSARTTVDEQSGTAGGWFWWVRIIFGERISTPSNADSADLDPPTPTSALKSIPSSTRTERVAYWWDLAFSNRDAVDELFDSIRAVQLSGSSFAASLATSQARSRRGTSTGPHPSKTALDGLGVSATGEPSGRVSGNGDRKQQQQQQDDANGRDLFAAQGQWPYDHGMPPLPNGGHSDGSIVFICGDD